MTSNEKLMLSILAECEEGKGRADLNLWCRRMAGRMISKGWTESMSCGLFTVYLITQKGREALAQEKRRLEGQNNEETLADER